ncbi:hypothetical protein IW261DRAFT_264556 [Armillaria novae-zelandiae]|uniref:Uncharacterized protein n=1 Tax=Armillaria novae-zelandiae TaxID=153914 RepID=A0AA39TB90_9AGAR|nr:hypothetical protein IW261DRAFT_264556 [Armillaria novae-zelandiae]
MLSSQSIPRWLVVNAGVFTFSYTCAYNRRSKVQFYTHEHKFQKKILFDETLLESMSPELSQKFNRSNSRWRSTKTSRFGQLGHVSDIDVAVVQAPRIIVNTSLVPNTECTLTQ